MAKAAPRAAWLVKSEPYKYPFDQLVADGHTVWDGVRNFEARNNLRAMKKGDPVLYYHSNEGKAVVGVARVSREAFPDETGKDDGKGDWSAVELEPVKALPRPVTLDELRAHETLSKMMIIRRPRISVVPVTPEELATVLEVAKKKP
ncbi:MAG TPA: EVE domain-containing protein [Polyangiaceae bacterium]|nr:EVE domain-containing protein [Polyangiaceae bacterium]